jgi:hypothetical protein
VKYKDANEVRLVKEKALIVQYFKFICPKFPRTAEQNYVKPQNCRFPDGIKTATRCVPNVKRKCKLLYLRVLQFANEYTECFRTKDKIIPSYMK